MTEAEAISELERALDRWVRGREIMKSGMARMPSDWRDMSTRLMALDDAIMVMYHFEPHSTAVADLIRRADESMGADADWTAFQRANPRSAA